MPIKKGTNLSKASLSQANLSGADLSPQANLFNTNFTKAIVNNTSFTKTVNMKYSIGLEINNPITKSPRKKKYGNGK